MPHQNTSFVIPRVSSRHLFIYRFIHHTVPFCTDRDTVILNSSLALRSGRGCGRDMFPAPGCKDVLREKK